MDTSRWQPGPYAIRAIKVTFYNSCSMYGIDEQTLSVIAQMAGIDPSIVTAMYRGGAVRRGDATKIVQALSDYTEAKWTLDNMLLALLPTFAEILGLHKNLDLTKVASIAGVAYALLEMMTVYEPVPENEARYVLSALSQETGNNYSLDTVDIAIKAEEIYNHD